jgi:hypothetical protein
MSKFKVGDNVKAISNKYAFTTLECGWTGVVVSISTREHCFSAKTITGHDSSEGHVYRGLCFEDFELIEKEEFTFEEVIARIKEGEVYQNSLSSISKIDGCIEVVSINRSGRTIPKGEEYTVRFETNNYKLVPQKNNYLLFEVEHQEGGKRYLFRSDCNYNLGDIVICQTSLGKSYGKIVYKVIKELTEEEFKAYKPIIKSV